MIASGERVLEKLKRYLFSIVLVDLAYFYTEKYFHNHFFQNGAITSKKIALLAIRVLLVHSSGISKIALKSLTFFSLSGVISEGENFSKLEIGKIRANFPRVWEVWL